MSTKIKNIINELTKSVNPVENTVDTLLFGDSDREISKIAVSFMPTYDVIRQAIDIGANLLICHEGVFYNHKDGEISEENHVYKEKRKLIHESGISIYRFHDYIHRYKPDGIMTGMINALQWEPFIVENTSTETIVNLPPMTMREVIDYLKEQLMIDFIRYVGDLSMDCSRTALLVGYRGGSKTVLPAFEEKNVDLVIYGEGPEWETPEYVRDAVDQGRNKGVIMLGHLESEEPGMKYLANLTQSKFPETLVHFIPTDQCIKVL